MSTATITSRPARAGTGDGGVPARRAVIRWAWRLFRREWRQQLLVLGLLSVAVAATIWGAGVATNTPPPATATFGTATAAISLPGNDPLRIWLDGWFIQAPQPLTSAQISAARQIAANAGVTVETKSGELGLNQISDGATVLGLVIALGVLVMSVGLVRSETSGELRTLAATGASSRIRRSITSATAGAIGLTVTFGRFPVLDVLALLAGLPLVAVAGGWLLAGRQPQVIARQPLE